MCSISAEVHDDGSSQRGGEGEGESKTPPLRVYHLDVVHLSDENLVAGLYLLQGSLRKVFIPRNHVSDKFRSSVSEKERMGLKDN